MGSIVTCRRTVNGTTQNSVAMLRKDILSTDHSQFKVCERFIDLLATADDTEWDVSQKEIISVVPVRDEVVAMEYKATVDLIMKNLIVPNMGKTVMLQLVGVTEDNFLEKLDYAINSLTNDGLTPVPLYNHTDFLITNAIFDIR